MSGDARDVGSKRKPDTLRDHNLAASKERIRRTSEPARISPNLHRIHAKYGMPLRCLDVGCGIGQILELLGPDSVGVDYLLENSRVCMQRGLAVVRADANVSLPFRAGSFEAAICSNTLEHMRSPLWTLEEIHRVLVDNGIVVLCLPTYKSVIRSLVDDYFENHLSHVFAFDLQSVRRLLSIAGFRVVETCLDVPKSHSSIAAKALQRAFSMSPRLFSWLSSSYWVVAEKA